MIQIQNNQFTCLCDGWSGKHFTEMKCLKSSDEDEFNVLFIDIETDMPKKENDKYHFAPIVLEKEELKQFISYLQSVYDVMI